MTFLNDNDDEYDVVCRMMEYLEALSKECYERLQLRYNDIFRKLDKTRDEAITKEANAMNGIGVERVVDRFDRLEEELHKYLTDLLCFGFQSKGFDIPVMKQHIVRYLLKGNNKNNVVIKKGSKYMTLQTGNIR